MTVQDVIGVGLLIIMVLAIWVGFAARRGGER